MNREELVAFLNENYEADELLIWQTIAKSDLESMLGGDIADDKWESFVEENQDYLAEQMSRNARDEGYDLIEEEEEEDD